MKLYITIPEGELRESFLDSTSMKTLEENFDVVKNESGRNLTEEELAKIAEIRKQLGASAHCLWQKHSWAFLQGRPCWVFRSSLHCLQNFSVNLKTC